MSTITLPDGCKPSMGCSQDGTRPVLTHGYLKRRQDGLWLLTTDAYIAIALRVDGDADEGWLPVDALKKMETRDARRGNLKFEQVDRRSWKVSNVDESIVTVYTAKVKDDAEFPNLETIGDGLLFDGTAKRGKATPFGFDPELLARVGKALGGSLRTEVSAPLQPIRLTALGFAQERLAIQMPIRLMEDEAGLRAVAERKAA